MALYLVNSHGLKEEQINNASGLSFVEDQQKETRLAEALSNKGISVLTKLTTKGVLVSGTEFDARAVGNVLADGLFADSVNVAPKIRADFGAAVVPFAGHMARRPSITGGMHLAA